MYVMFFVVGFTVYALIGGLVSRLVCKLNEVMGWEKGEHLPPPDAMGLFWPFSIPVALFIGWAVWTYNLTARRKKKADLPQARIADQ